MTKIKKQLIKKAINNPFEVGELVLVEDQYLSKYSTSNTEFSAKIISIKGNYAQLEVSRYTQNLVVDVHILNIKHPIYNVGANPFSKVISRASQISTTLDSILGKLRLDKKQTHVSDEIYTGKNGKLVDFLNWNPYVIDNNNVKKYYQRDFVWTLEDKQLLIDSIYNRISIGKIIVKKNDFKTVMNAFNSGEKEIGLYDIIDGKQRLNAIQEFVNDIITDSYGNYFSDLSDQAQDEFYDYMGLSFYMLPTDATDDEILHEFLSVNFTGVQMSKEHIEYVKSIKL